MLSLHSINGKTQFLTNEQCSLLGTACIEMAAMLAQAARQGSNEKLHEDSVELFTISRKLNEAQGNDIHTNVSGNPDGLPSC